MLNRTKRQRQDVQRLLREDYPERMEQLKILPERIATERARLTAIRSASAEGQAVRGASGNVRQERDTAIITLIDQLKAEQETAKREVRVITQILDTLDPLERKTVDYMDISRQKDGMDRLCQELGYERTRVYEIYNGALDKIARMYGPPFRIR